MSYFISINKNKQEVCDMAYLIALDDGHGMETPGKRTPVIPELGRSIKENEFNKAVVYYLDKELKRCGFKTLLVAAGDSDIPLATRTNRANSAGADAYISCHYNAGGGEGVETYHYPGSTKGNKLAQCVHKYVIQGTKQKNRGVKSANFHVLRESRMPAILVEYGFMDDPGLKEARLMLNKDFQIECARETAKGICEYFGVKYVPDTSEQEEKKSVFPHMLRIEVDGKVVVDTQVPYTLNSYVDDALFKGASEVKIYKREDV
jgi:N-acetylmuramoyl-L-alanine amidase